MKYRAEIDGLRALAVVPVILFHAGFELFSGGFIGVDVFFVISGYLITTILIEDIENKRFSIVNFYERRARRIFPALFFVVLCCIPFAIVYLSPNDLRDFAQSIFAVGTFASNILFWMESGYFDQAAELKPLLHTWSLAVEEQYYVVFPIFLFLIWRLGKNSVLWIIVLIACISLGLSEWGWRNAASANFYLAPTRAWEIFAGSIVAFIVQKRGVEKNNSLALLGLGAILFSILGYDSRTPFPSIYALPPVVGVVLLILFADKETFVAKLLSARPLVGIGLVSYSAYLWHQPIFAFSKLLSFGEITSAHMLFLFLITVALAYGSWRFIEKPFRDKKQVSRKIVFTVAVFFLISCSSLGLFYHFEILPQKRVVQLSWLPSSYKMPSKFLGISQDGKNCVSREPSNACLIGGDHSDSRLVILGDSHATVLTQAAKYFSQIRDLQFVDLSASGCPFLPGLNTYTYGRPAKCDASYQKRRIDYLKKLSPAIILLHSRYAMYLHGHGFNNTIGGAESNSYYVGKTGLENFEERLELYYQSFKLAIKVLLDSGHKVVIVGGVPANGWHTMHRLQKIESAGAYSEYLKVAKLMSIPKSAVLARNFHTNQIINKLVEEYPNVLFLDSVEMLCKRTICLSIAKNKILYTDIDHLSFDGAKMLLEAVLDKLN